MRLLLVEDDEDIRQRSNVPVIILSAKDTDADKTLGLGLGADDYITKPPLRRCRRQGTAGSCLISKSCI